MKSSTLIILAGIGGFGYYLYNNQSKKIEPKRIFLHAKTVDDLKKNSTDYVKMPLWYIIYPSNINTNLVEQEYYKLKNKYSIILASDKLFSEFSNKKIEPQLILIDKNKQESFPWEYIKNNNNNNDNNNNNVDKYNYTTVNKNNLLFPIDEFESNYKNNSIRYINVKFNRWPIYGIVINEFQDKTSTPTSIHYDLGVTFEKPDLEDYYNIYYPIYAPFDSYLTYPDDYDQYIVFHGNNSTLEIFAYLDEYQNKTINLFKNKLNSFVKKGEIVGISNANKWQIRFAKITINNDSVLKLNTFFDIKEFDSENLNENSFYPIINPRILLGQDPEIVFY